MTEPDPPGTMRLRCYGCRCSISTPVPQDTDLRAVSWCAGCIKELHSTVRRAAILELATYLGQRPDSPVLGQLLRDAVNDYLAAHPNEEPAQLVDELTVPPSNWGGVDGLAVMVKVAGRADLMHWGTVLTGDESASFFVRGQEVVRARIGPARGDTDMTELVVNDTVLVDYVTRLSEQCRDTALTLASGSDVVADLVRIAVLRSFGCTCQQLGNAAVYAEDALCPLHHPQTEHVLKLFGDTPT